MVKLNRVGSNINSIKGKGKEMNCSSGHFPTQPPINPYNMAFIDSYKISLFR